MRVLLITLRSLVWAVLIAVSLPFFWSLTTGGTALVVSGESMVPTYEKGDVVFVTKVDSPPKSFWEEGEIVAVAFSASAPDDDLYIHRVKDVLPDGRATLKGDGNKESDVSPVTLAQVYGTPQGVLHQPAAATYAYTQSWWGRLTIFGIGALSLILIEIVLTGMKRRSSPIEPDTSEVGAPAKPDADATITEELPTQAQFPGTP